MVSCCFHLDEVENGGIKCGNLVVKKNKEGAPGDVVTLRVYSI